MKKLIDVIPITLMVSLVPFLFYTEPNMAQSVIVTAVTALVGYKYYLDSLKQLDYVKIFKEELEKRDEASKNMLETIYKDIGDVREKQGRLNLMQTNEQKIQNFKW